MSSIIAVLVLIIEPKVFALEKLETVVSNHSDLNDGILFQFLI